MLSKVRKACREKTKQMKQVYEILKIVCPNKAVDLGVEASFSIALN